MLNSTFVCLSKFTRKLFSVCFFFFFVRIHLSIVSLWSFLFDSFPSILYGGHPFFFVLFRIFLVQMRCDQQHKNRSRKKIIFQKKEREKSVETTATGPFYSISHLATTEQKNNVSFVRANLFRSPFLSHLNLSNDCRRRRLLVLLLLPLWMRCSFATVGRLFAYLRSSTDTQCRRHIRNRFVSEMCTFFGSRSRFSHFPISCAKPAKSNVILVLRLLPTSVGLLLIMTTSTMATAKAMMVCFVCNTRSCVSPISYSFSSSERLRALVARTCWCQQMEKTKVRKIRKEIFSFCLSFCVIHLVLFSFRHCRVSSNLFLFRFVLFCFVSLDVL